MIELFDRVLNDPTASPEQREYRRGFLNRNPSAAEQSPNEGDRVLEGGQACSDDAEFNLHGGAKFGKGPT